MILLEKTKHSQEELRTMNYMYFNTLNHREKSDRIKWSQIKDDWMNLALTFYQWKENPNREPTQKRLSSLEILLLTLFKQRMGNGGKYNHGELKFTAERIADYLGLEGTKESKKRQISRARRKVEKLGFIERLKDGTGGNGYRNKAPVYYISFAFIDNIGTTTDPTGKVPSIAKRHTPSIERGGAPGGAREDNGGVVEGTPSVPPKGTPSVPLIKDTGLIQGRDKGDSVSRPELRNSVGTAPTANSGGGSVVDDLAASNSEATMNGGERSLHDINRERWEYMGLGREDWRDNPSMGFREPEPNPFSAFDEAG